MKVLVADDDRDINDLLRYIFQREGFNVLTAEDGMGAWHSFLIEAPDLVILDVNMPKRDGLELLRALRAQSHVPVIMVTIATDEASIVRALELGADDYMTKPFRVAELRARVRALLRRRHNWIDSPLNTKRALTRGDIFLDPNTCQVTVRGAAVHLTRTEFSLLHYLILNMGIVVRTNTILENVWGYDTEESDEVVRVTISRLRKKIEPDPSLPRYIINTPGIGYKFICSDS